MTLEHREHVDGLVEDAVDHAVVAEDQLALR